MLRLPLVLRPVLVVPGIAVTVEAMHLADRSTVVWPTVIVASVLAVLVADADESLAGSAVGPPLLAVSIFGMYVTIPETGQILPVLVVAVPIALVGAPLCLARLGAAGSGRDHRRSWPPWSPRGVRPGRRRSSAAWRPSACSRSNPWRAASSPVHLRGRPTGDRPGSWRWPRCRS